MGRPFPFVFSRGSATIDGPPPPARRARPDVIYLRHHIIRLMGRLRPYCPYPLSIYRMGSIVRGLLPTPGCPGRVMGQGRSELLAGIVRRVAWFFPLSTLFMIQSSNHQWTACVQSEGCRSAQTNGRQSIDCAQVHRPLEPPPGATRPHSEQARCSFWLSAWVSFACCLLFASPPATQSIGYPSNHWSNSLKV